MEAGRPRQRGFAGAIIEMQAAVKRMGKPGSNGLCWGSSGWCAPGLHSCNTDGRTGCAGPNWYVYVRG